MYGEENIEPKPYIIVIVIGYTVLKISFSFSSATEAVLQYSGASFGCNHHVRGHQNRYRAYSVHPRKIVLSSYTSYTHPPHSYEEAISQITTRAGYIGALHVVIIHHLENIKLQREDVFRVPSVS